MLTIWKVDSSVLTLGHMYGAGIGVLGVGKVGKDPSVGLFSKTVVHLLNVYRNRVKLMWSDTYNRFINHVESSSVQGSAEMVQNSYIL